MSYKELIQKRADLINERKGIFARADAEKRGLTDEEKARDDAIETELQVVATDLEREERRRKWEREAAPVAQPAQVATITGVHDRAGDAPWESFGHFLQAVAAAGAPGGRVDARLYQAGPSGANEGLPSEGGFLVRHDYSTVLLDAAVEAAVLAPLCRQVEIGADSDGLDMPYIDESSRATGSRWGGVQVYWRAEADTVADSHPKFESHDLRLQELMGIAYATNRLLRDASALQSIFTTAFTSEMAFKLDDAIFRGNGAGLPLGFIDSAGPRVEQAKEGGQLADTITANNISAMWKNVAPRSKGRGVWFYNSECTEQFDKLYVAAGASALEPRVITYSESGVLRIKGRPAIELEQCSALGDAGDFVFADLAEYILIRKGGIEAAQSMHVRFLYGENTYRWTYPVNGRPIWRTSKTPYKGASGAKISPFVTLAPRA